MKRESNCRESTLLEHTGTSARNYPKPSAPLSKPKHWAGQAGCVASALATRSKQTEQS